MYIFLKDLKFEAKGGAAADVGISTISVFLFVLSVFGIFLMSNFFLYLSIFFFITWISLTLKFFLFVYKMKGIFIINALIINFWFSNVISLGAFWGLTKWLFGKRD